MNQDNELTTSRLTEAQRVIAVRGQGYFPVLTRLEDGSLGAVIRGGAPHVGREGRLDWIRSEDGGKTWSRPTVVADGEWDDRNPACGQMPDGAIVVAYAEASTYNEKGEFDRSVGKYEAYYVLSADGGLTWSERRKLFTGPLRHVSPFGKMILLRDGTAVMSIYGQRAENEPQSADFLVPGARLYAGVIRSRDNGRSWEDFSSIGHLIGEVALLYLEHGNRLLAFCRGESREHQEIWQAESRDGGYSWAGFRRLTKRSQHPADCLCLRSGNLLLAFGNRLEPFGAGVMVSRDGGGTWDVKGRTLIGWDSESTDCGYPSSAQLEDGTIVTMYYSVGTESEPGVEMAIAVRYSERMLLGRSAAKG